MTTKDDICKQPLTLKTLWDAAILLNYSVVLWRNPSQGQIHFLADLSKKPAKNKLDFETGDIGFVISPFINHDGKETIFLKPDIHVVYVKDNNEAFTINNGMNNREFWQEVKECSGAKTRYHINKITPNHGSEESDRKAYFVNMAQNALDSIAKRDFDKVIVARTLNTALDDNFDVVEQFYRLQTTYADAFVSLVSIPDIGTWMGVSPELLIESSSEQFRTISMAATVPVLDNADLSQATWNQKEIEEQAMVSRYITEQFNSISLEKFEETGPRSIRAANMLHLKTEYSVNLSEVMFPDLATKMLHLLHPTSAVCGMPKLPALKFIVDNEAFNREFYSGFLGPVNISEISNSQCSCLYVNLRCMQLFSKHAVLYAGAGITHDSTPQKEWDETSLKCMTLLDVINGN